MTARVEHIAAHLANLPGGIGCRYLARDRDGLGSELLVALGLVHPIASRVPRCTDHGCPLAGSCPHQADFEPEAKGGKAGVKYKPTPAGLAAATDPAVIESAILELPAAREILALRDRGLIDPFQLHAVFMAQARAAIRAGNPVDNPALSRVTLRAVLDLLTEAGVVDAEQPS